jgi:hypothetical protein
MRKKIEEKENTRPKRETFCCYLKGIKATESQKAM